MIDDSAEVPVTRVFGERVLYDNPWVRLVRVDIEPPDGRRFWHHVVRLQTVVTALVLDDDGSSILMLHRHRFATDQIGWEAPGGIVGPEESPETAAVRETLEETGWKPRGAGSRMLRFQPMPGMVDTPHDVFLFRGAEHIAEPTDQEEAGIIDWVPLEEVTALVRRGEVLGSGSLVGLLSLLADLGPEA